MCTSIDGAGLVEAIERVLGYVNHSSEVCGCEKEQSSQGAAGMQRGRQGLVILFGFDFCQFVLILKGRVVYGEGG